jgi:uncharacterized membrane protein
MWKAPTTWPWLMPSLAEVKFGQFMNQTFWARMHGGATHFPLALLAVSVAFDLAGFWWRDELRGREFRSLGFYSLLIAAAASPVAVVSGIALSKGVVWGTGLLALHHYFIWPAFGFLIGLAVWRLVVREGVSRRARGGYLVLASLTLVAMLAAGYWGGEMMIGK